MALPFPFILVHDICKTQSTIFRHHWEARITNAFWSFHHRNNLTKLAFTFILHGLRRIEFVFFRHPSEMQGVPILFDNFTTDKIWRNSHLDLYSCMIYAEIKQILSGIIEKCKGCQVFLTIPLQIQSDETSMFIHIIAWFMQKGNEHIQNKFRNTRNY